MSSSSSSTTGTAVAPKKNATTAIGYFWKAREMLTPTLKKTAFLEKGVLTPEEFVRAGDELVYRCPTWSWCSSGEQKAYLPPDKQYLVTRNIPCRDRVATMEQQMFLGGGNLMKMVLETEDGGTGSDGDEWMISDLPNKNHTLTSSIEDEFDVLDEDGEVCQPTNTIDMSIKQVGEGTDDDEYADMADYEDDNVLVDDDAAVAKPVFPLTDDNIVKVRTYDLSITYDKYYQTPRIWMLGRTANGDSLTAKQTMEDVMTDYANKTVTMEAHPHIFGVPHASIHPCKHGKVMKAIVQNLKTGDNSEGPSVEMYLFIFLKFVSSIIPGISYDWTFDVKANTSK